MKKIIVSILVIGLLLNVAPLTIVGERVFEEALSDAISVSHTISDGLGAMGSNRDDGTVDSFSFITESENQDLLLLEGWPVNLETVGILASPNSYDFNGDGKEEIVIATYGPNEENKYDEGRIYVIYSDGIIANGWPFITEGPAPATPAIGDLNNDGIPEIVAICWNFIYILHFNGSVVWQKYINKCYCNSPVLVDIDMDGLLEIIVSTYSGKIFAWNYSGANVIGWPITINQSGDFRISTPAVCDLDKDGYIEIVVNTEDNKTYVFNHDGTVADGWPVVFPINPNSSGINFIRPPAVADLDGDGDFEIIRDGGKQLYVLEHDGSIAKGWPQDIEYYFNNAFSLGDIDSDSLPEIVFGRSDTSGYGYLYAFNSDGSDVNGWPIIFDWNVYPVTPCAIADVNSDLLPEIIVRCKGELYIFNADGSILDGWPQGNISDNPFGSTFMPSPLVTDLNGDGNIEIVAPSDFDSVYLWDLQGVYDKETMEWPMFQHDSRNTGSYNRPPNAPTITGPTSGNPNVEYEYSFVTTDSDDNNVYYYIDWGDGYDSSWLGPYGSSEEVTVGHKWSEKGTYTIRAKARDIHGAESGWGTLSVTMPVNQPSGQQSSITTSTSTATTITTKNYLSSLFFFLFQNPAFH